MVGVYKIENKINGKVYIGQSVDVNKRLKAHKSLLNKNEHQNQRLQDDWNVYGESAFCFELIKKCRSNKLNQIEKTLIKEYQSSDEAHGYNISKGLGKNMGYETLATPNPVNEDSYYRNERGVISYNEACATCKNACKQSFRATILICPAMS